MYGQQRAVREEFAGTPLGEKIAQAEKHRAELRAKEWLRHLAEGKITRDDIQQRLSALAPRAQEATRKQLNELARKLRGNSER